MQYWKCFNIAFSKGIQFYHRLFKIKNLAQSSFYFLLNKLLYKNMSKSHESIPLKYLSRISCLSKQQMFSAWVAIGLCLLHQRVFPILLAFFLNIIILFLHSVLSLTLLKRRLRIFTIAALQSQRSIHHLKSRFLQSNYFRLLKHYL